MVSLYSNRTVDWFHAARTTSELGEAPSGMSAISSPAMLVSGSTRTGWPAASGPGPASGSSPPRHVRMPRWPGICGCSMWPGAASPAGVTRQKPPLWSATHVRPVGSTSAPVETCSPSPTSVDPAACAGTPVAAMRVRAAPNAMPIRGSVRNLLDGSMWRSSLRLPDTGSQGPRTPRDRAARKSHEAGARTRTSGGETPGPEARVPTGGGAGVPPIHMELGAGPMLEDLLRRTHLSAPHQLAEIVSEAAEAMGARQTVLYVIDYELKT